MAKQLQLRRGTTSQHSTFTGANGEVTIDTDKKVVVVHDGATAGGIPLAKQATVDTKVSKVTSTDNAIVRFNGTTGDVQNSGVIIDDSNSVGVGTNTSSWNSGFKAVEIANGCSLWTSNTVPNVYLTANAYFNAGSAYTYSKSGYNACKYEQSSGNHIWSSAISGTSGNAVTWTNAMILDVSGNLLLTSGTGGLGYGTGAGGTVTQLTSKSMAVTLNKPTGLIIMNNAALAAGATVEFILNNSLISPNDTVNVNLNNLNAAGYNVWATSGNNGISVIRVKNVIGSSMSDALPIQFSIVKGVQA